jgi:hypothetical protein
VGVEHQADLVAVQFLMLATFFGLQYLLRPQRALRVLRNHLRGSGQETNMDQFLSAKRFYRRKKREIRTRADRSLAAERTV